MSDDLFSALAVSVTKLQCKISQLENKCKNQTTYVHELNSELFKEREETKRVNEIIEELLSQENLLKENIDRTRQSNAAAEESFSDLKNQVALEVETTRQLKIEQDEALAKYSARWESYLEIYNSFPLVQERNNLSFVRKAQEIQINLLKYKIFETRNKLNLLECIKEKMEQVLVKRIAEAYKVYNNEIKKMEQFLHKIRKVKQEIELVKAEKAAVVGNIGSKIDETKEQAGSLTWNYPGIKKSWTHMLPDFNITSPPSLNFSDWNTRATAEKTRIGLKINNSLETSLTQLIKHQNSNKFNNYLENSKTSFNVTWHDINNRTTILETDRLFSGDEKQKNMQEYFPDGKTKQDQENHKFIQNLELLDRKTIPETLQTDRNVNEMSQNGVNDKISTNKPTIKTSLKQKDLLPGEAENPSVVIQINTAHTNANTSQMDLNIPLRSLIDKTNLKRQNENSNYDYDTEATLNAIKSKYNPDNKLQTINANSVQNPTTNVQMNQNKENITFSYKNFCNNNTISDLKSQLANITSFTMQKLNLGLAQSENEKHQSENDSKMKYSVSNPQSKVPKEITVMVQSPPDLLLIQPTQVLSQDSNNICSSEFITPIELDEAGRIAYMKIVEESPGYENHLGPRMCNKELSQRSEFGEQSHYFINPMSHRTQEGSQDEARVVYSPPFNYRPPPGSYILSPPPAEIPPSDSTYVHSPSAGGGFGDGNFTSCKPSTNEMPSFGSKMGGTLAKIDSEKTEGFSFSFADNPSKPVASIFNLF